MPQTEQHPGYNHQTLSDYQTILRQYHADEDEKEPPAPEYLQGSVVVLNNADGGILALVGGRDFSESQFDRAIASPRAPRHRVYPVRVRGGL